MIYFVLSFFLITTLLPVTKKKWEVFTYINGVYLFSLIISVHLILSGKYNNEEISLVPSLVYCICILILLLPFYRKVPELSLSLKDVRLKKKFKTIGYCISILFLTSMVLMLPAALASLAIGASDIRNGLGENLISKLPWISRVFAYSLYYLSGLSYMLILFFFISYTQLKRERLLNTLLLLSSLAAPYMGILLGGRTNLIYWLLFFFFGIVLFYPLIGRKRIVKMSLPVCGLLAVMYVYFMYTTESRFENSNITATESLYTYAGGSFVNFCKYFDGINTFDFTLKRIFPITTSLVEGQNFDIVSYREHVEAQTGLDIGTFYTLLGDLYVDVGFIGMVIYCILYNIITSTFLNSSRKLTIDRIIVLGVLVQIPLHGLFYYSYWTNRASYAIIISLAIAFYLKYKVPNPLSKTC